MTRLHQAFWPYVGMDDDMNNTKALTPLRLWQEAYLTSLEVGVGAYAKQIADKAVEDLAQHTGLVYSQNEGGNTPYPRDDEVAGCLRGAIPAMEMLRDCDPLSARRFPGLDDLIARSKKALGDC